jgi:hypothetical protein
LRKASLGGLRRGGPEPGQPNSAASSVGPRTQPPSRTARIAARIASPRRVPIFSPLLGDKDPPTSCLCRRGRWPSEAAPSDADGRRAATGLRTGHRRRGRSPAHGQPLGRRGRPRSDRAASEQSNGATAPGHLVGKPARRQQESAGAPDRKRRESETRRANRSEGEAGKPARGRASETYS